MRTLTCGARGNLKTCPPPVLHIHQRNAEPRRPGEKVLNLRGPLHTDEASADHQAGGRLVVQALQEVEPRSQKRCQDDTGLRAIKIPLLPVEDAGQQRPCRKVVCIHIVATFHRLLLAM